MTARSKVATVFLLGFFLDLINMFIASVAFPGMSRALNASVSELAWVSNGYIAGLTLVVPFSAWLTQRCGLAGSLCSRSRCSAPQRWPAD
jgi:MFS family permease